MAIMTGNREEIQAGPNLSELPKRRPEIKSGDYLIVFGHLQEYYAAPPPRGARTVVNLGHPPDRGIDVGYRCDTVRTSEGLVPVRSLQLRYIGAASNSAKVRVQLVPALPYPLQRQFPHIEVRAQTPGHFRKYLAIK
jgi:hypothetical protein